MLVAALVAVLAPAGWGRPRRHAPQGGEHRSPDLGRLAVADGHPDPAPPAAAGHDVARQRHGN